MQAGQAGDKIRPVRDNATVKLSLVQSFPASSLNSEESFKKNSNQTSKVAS